MSERLEDDISTTLEWAAGILDGEGWLGTYGDRRGRRYLAVAVNNTHRPMLERLQMLFGHGAIYDHSPRNSRHKPLWTWRLTGANAPRAVSEVWPWLGAEKRGAWLRAVQTVSQQPPPMSRYMRGVMSGQARRSKNINPQRESLFG